MSINSTYRSALSLDLNIRRLAKQASTPDWSPEKIAKTEKTIKTVQQIIEDTRAKLLTLHQKNYPKWTIMMKELNVIQGHLNDFSQKLLQQKSAHGTELHRKHMEANMDGILSKVYGDKRSYGTFSREERELVEEDPSEETDYFKSEDE